MPINLHLWLVPGLCLAGFLLNLVFGRLWGKSIAGAVGVGFSGLALLAALWVAHRWSGAPYIEPHATWFLAGPLRVSFGLFLDPLSLLMMLIVTGVGFLIHLYSLGYMSEEGGFYRYFSLLNLFLFFMLTLVLAGNYLLLFAGWEGVGFASYILIGFFFRRDAAARAGIKAFVVNRIGDFGFLLGLFLIFARFGSFNYQTVFARAATLPVESGWHGPLTVIALLLLVGALGKSAQLPLYIWLPDAMEGPTPVSALIHAATMVTAGVYMIARSAVIYDHSPAARSLVLAIGALTAIFAASIGVLQRDIKRILAYSTISQIGYMFMACGVAAYGAGVFHLMTHAFFKALLFLGAGSVIHAMHGEQDIFRIRSLAPGGLKRYAPITFWTFVIATCAISGIPGFSGYFSKDLILERVFAATSGAGRIWWALGLVAAFLTAFYMFRALFVTFFPAPAGAPESAAHPTGQEPAGAAAAGGHGNPENAPRHALPHESPAVMTIPLLGLAVLAALGGYLNWGDRLLHFLAPAFSPTPNAVAYRPLPQFLTAGVQHALMALTIAVALGGLLLAWVLYRRRPRAAAQWAEAVPGLYRLVFNKYWVDEFFDAVLITPLRAISHWVLWRGVDDGLIAGSLRGIGGGLLKTSDGLRRQISGSLRSYAAWIAAGACAAVIYMGWLTLR